MIPHYLLWKKLQNKRFTIPVKEEWNSFTEQKRETGYGQSMICRVCMSPADIPITEKLYDQSILSAIRSVSNIWINESDGCPQYICDVCLVELKTAFIFKKKCEESEKKFRETLPAQSAFEHSPPPMLYHDFAQIIQDMRDRARRRELKRAAKQTAAKRKIKKEDPNQIHKCKRCDVVFQTKEQLKCHRRDRACFFAACPICHKVVSNVARHKKIVHQRAENHTCPVCGKISFTAGSARIHLGIHSETANFACPLCPYRGKQQAYLSLHMRVHTGERPYLCNMCPANFVNSSNLRKHQLTHSNKQYLCSKCNKTFRTEKSLQEHYNAAHLHMRYRCSICGRYLWTRRKLLSHELRVHNREKRKMYAETCKVVVNEEN